MHEEKPEIRRVDESEVEQRSLSQVAAQAAEAGALTFGGTLGALGAKDLYGKAKDVIRPNEEKPEDILPPGTSDE
jgi:hypothetical protein